MASGNPQNSEEWRTRPTRVIIDKELVVLRNQRRIPYRHPMTPNLNEALLSHWQPNTSVRWRRGRRISSPAPGKGILVQHGLWQAAQENRLWTDEHGLEHGRETWEGFVAPGLAAYRLVNETFLQQAAVIPEGHYLVMSSLNEAMGGVKGMRLQETDTFPEGIIGRTLQRWRPGTTVASHDGDIQPDMAATSYLPLAARRRLVGDCYTIPVGESTLQEAYLRVDERAAQLRYMLLRCEEHQLQIAHWWYGGMSKLTRSVMVMPLDETPPAAYPWSLPGPQATA